MGSRSPSSRAVGGLVQPRACPRMWWYQPAVVAHAKQEKRLCHTGTEARPGCWSLCCHPCPCRAPWAPQTRSAAGRPPWRRHGSQEVQQISRPTQAAAATAAAAGLIQPLHRTQVSPKGRPGRARRPPWTGRSRCCCTHRLGRLRPLKRQRPHRQRQRGSTLIIHGWTPHNVLKPMAWSVEGTS